MNNAQMKGIRFPSDNHFSLCVEESIVEEFQQLIDSIFVIGQLKGLRVGSMEFVGYFSIVVFSNETLCLNLLFDNNIYLKCVEIEDKNYQLNTIDTIKKFIELI